MTGKIVCIQVHFLLKHYSIIIADLETLKGVINKSHTTNWHSWKRGTLSVTDDWEEVATTYTQTLTNDGGKYSVERMILSSYQLEQPSVIFCII